ncbi:hypothetical protein AB852_25855 [Streptomyces uncialis]|uniref:Uncharacterized protein n=1 Tax=Streptomyces uncialis TaxID=1048205 RepID=A0A1Q4V392_9ACTN|nr:hypothetical protein AB852_25855 [Streptomyces uncialis]
MPVRPPGSARSIFSLVPEVPNRSGARCREFHSVVPPGQEQQGNGDLPGLLAPGAGHVSPGEGSGGRAGVVRSPRRAVRGPATAGRMPTAGRSR